MTLSEDDKDELRNIIRPAIENFAECVRNEIPEIRNKRYYSTSERVIKTIPKPSEHIIGFSLRQDEFFEDAANKLLQEGLLFEPNKIDYKIGPKWEREWNKSVYQNQIFHFAWEVFNYSGEISIEDDPFEEAFENFLLPKFKNITEYQIIIPVHNLSIDNRGISLPLSSDTDVFERDENYHEINKIQLVKLKEEYENAIALYENPALPESPTTWADDCECAIVADIFSTGLENSPSIPGIEIGKRILTAIRLDNSGSVWNDNMIFESVYLAEDSWFEYRTNIPMISDHTSYNRSQRTTLKRGNNYGADAEFAEFWNNHRNLIRFDSEYTLSGALRRFNEMHLKHYPEDQILDCLIACESTLLRSGGVVKSSITSSLKLFASMLLDGRTRYSRSEIRDIFMELYRLRGEIVHENKTLDTILSDGDFEEIPEEVDLTIGLAREMLASILRAYMAEKLQNGRSVGATNQLINDAINEAPYPPD